MLSTDMRVIQSKLWAIRLGRSHDQLLLDRGFVLGYISALSAQSLNFEHAQRLRELLDNASKIAFRHAWDLESQGWSDDPLQRAGVHP